MLLISILLYLFYFQIVTCDQFYVAQDRAKSYFIENVVGEAQKMADAAITAQNDPNVISSEAWEELFGFENAALRTDIRDRNYQRFKDLKPPTWIDEPYPGVRAGSIVWSSEKVQPIRCQLYSRVLAITNLTPFIPFLHASSLCNVIFTLPMIATTQDGESAARTILHGLQHMTGFLGLTEETSVLDIVNPFITQDPTNLEGCYTPYCCANIPASSKIRNAENYARFAQDARRDPDRVKGRTCLRLGPGEEALHSLENRDPILYLREHLLSSNLSTFSSSFTKASSRTTKSSSTNSSSTKDISSSLSLEKPSTRSSTTRTTSTSSFTKLLSTKAMSSSFISISSSTTLSSSTATSTSSSTTVSSTTSTLMSLSSSASSLSSSTSLPLATETIITPGPIIVKPGGDKTTVGGGQTITASKCETVIGGLGGCFFVLSDGGKGPVHLKHGQTATAGDPHNTLITDPDPDPSVTSATSSSSSSSRRTCGGKSSTLATRTFASTAGPFRGICGVTGTEAAEIAQLLLLASSTTSSSTSTSTSTTTSTISSSTGSIVPGVTRTAGDPNPRPTDTIPILTPESGNLREVSTTDGFTDSIDCFYSQGDGTVTNYHLNITLTMVESGKYSYALGCNCFDGQYAFALTFGNSDYSPSFDIPGVDGDRVVEIGPYSNDWVSEWEITAVKA